MTTPTTTDAAIAQASDTLYLALAGIKDTFPTGSVQRSAIWQAMHFVALAKNVPTETPATAHGGSGISIGTEIEGIPWTEEMERTFNKTMPKVRELVGLDKPSASGVVAYMVDGRVEQGLFFDKEAAENMASANCGTVIPLTASPRRPAIGKDGVRGRKVFPPAAFEEWFAGIEAGDGTIPVPQSIADGDAWHEHIGRRQIALGAWLAATEATTAAGLVDDAMVERAINSLADYQRSVTTWGEPERRESMRLALEAAMGREVGK